MTFFLVIFLELLALAASKTYFYFDHFFDGTITSKGVLLLGLIYIVVILFGFLYLSTRKGTKRTSMEEGMLRASLNPCIRYSTLVLALAFAIGIFTYWLKIDVVIRYFDHQMDTLVILLIICAETALFIQYHSSPIFRQKVDAASHSLVTNKIAIRFGQICLAQLFLLFLLLNMKIQTKYQYELIILVIFGVIFELYLLGIQVYETTSWPRHLPKVVSTNLEMYLVAILFIAFSVGKIIIISPMAHLMMAPTDGYQYWQMARQIFEGTLDIQAYHHYPPLYSFIISPAFLFPKADTLFVISIINGIVSSSVVFPIYLLARKFVPRPLAVFFTLVCMSHPDHLLFPSHPASEDLYYPVFFWTLYLVTTSAQKVKDQTLINILTGLFIGLCYLTRYQTFPLIPAFLFVWWFKPGVHNTGKGDWLPNTQKPIQLFVVISSFAIALSFWILPGLAQGVSFRDLLGFSVEGTDSLLQFDRSFSSLLFWSAATLGYVLLILGPLVPIFLSALKRIKDVSREPKLRHWLMAMSIIGSVLYITVVRHAWLAGYNQEEPNRLVTRYLIYMAAPAWLTVIATAKYIQKKDVVFYTIAAIISTCLVIISFEFFFNWDWILPGNILYINGNFPLYAEKIFYATVIGGSILSLFLIWKDKIHYIPTVMLLCIMYINLASLPLFRSFIMSYMVGGRFISEFIDQGILLEGMHPISEANSSLRTVETITHLDKQLTVRGLDPSQFIFESRADLSDYPDKTRMVLEIRPGEKYSIVEAYITDVKYQHISEFTFDGTTYELVRSD